MVKLRKLQNGALGSRCALVVIDLADLIISSIAGKCISICERWNNYAYFLADMGRKPAPKHSIDRIDRNGDYEPTNCRWASLSEQSKNRNFNPISKLNLQTSTADLAIDALLPIDRLV